MAEKKGQTVRKHSRIRFACDNNPLLSIVSEMLLMQFIESRCLYTFASRRGVVYHSFSLDSIQGDSEFVRYDFLDPDAGACLHALTRSVEIASLSRSDRLRLHPYLDRVKQYSASLL